MASVRTVNKTDIKIASLDKTELIAHILDFDGKFKFDFTRDYLETLDVNNLRHILSAATQVNT